MSLRTLGDVVNRAGGAVSVPDSVCVVDLSAALKTHNVDAAAVLTPKGVLAGIATSSDVARSLARGEDPLSTLVASVMTVHPTMLPPAETPANALALMRAGGFRHLPVVDASSGAVLGIVDVLHLAYDAIVRLHNSYSMPPTRRSFLFQRVARETIEKPTLRGFRSSTRYAALQPDSSALEACEALVRDHVTAIVIVDGSGSLEGIFTCRDVVSRVVCAGRDPATTSLRDIMTPRPDFALPDFTVLECLQRMQACGFRHLPIVEDNDRKVVGVVDVLQLASDALAGLAGSDGVKDRTGDMPSADNTSGGGFSGMFSSLFGSTSVIDLPEPLPPAPVDAAPMLSRRQSKTPSKFQSLEGKRQISVLDSADLARIRMSSHYAPGVQRGDVGRKGGVSSGYSRGGDSRLTGLETITFKFTDVDGEYRRIKVPRVATRGAFDQLVVDVRRRYYAGDFHGRSIRVKYIDEDGDAVVLGNDDDLAACFEECADQKLKTVKLKVSEVQSRRSITSVPSPVSSHPNSPPHPFSPIASSDTRPLSPGPNSVSQDSSSRPISIGSPSEHGSPGASPSTFRTIEAHQLMMDEKVTEAISKYNDAITLNDKNPRALAGRGAARLIGGDSVGAEKDYRASLKLLEEDGVSSTDKERTQDMVVVGLVETLIDQRRYEEAGEMAGKLDGKDAKVGCSDALNDELQGSSKLAYGALSSREYVEGTTFFTNAIRVEKAFIAASDGREACSASLLNGRAKCYFEMGDYEMALEDFECAAKLDPENVAAMKGCGKCYAELDRMPKALEAYQKAGKLDAGDEGVQEQIATLTKLLNPENEKKDSIAALSAVLGSMNFPGSVQKADGSVQKPGMTSRSVSMNPGGGPGGAKAKRMNRKKGKKSTGGTPPAGTC